MVRLSLDFGVVLRWFVVGSFVALSLLEFVRSLKFAKLSEFVVAGVCKFVVGVVAGHCRMPEQAAAPDTLVLSDEVIQDFSLHFFEDALQTRAAASCVGLAQEALGTSGYH